MIGCLLFREYIQETGDFLTLHFDLEDLLECKATAMKSINIENDPSLHRIYRDLITNPDIPMLPTEEGKF